jgi:hypothetical protein
MLVGIITAGDAERFNEPATCAAVCCLLSCDCAILADSIMRLYICSIPGTYSTRP